MRKMQSKGKDKKVRKLIVFIFVEGYYCLRATTDMYHKGKRSKEKVKGIAFKIRCYIKKN